MTAKAATYTHETTMSSHLVVSTANLFLLLLR